MDISYGRRFSKDLDIIRNERKVRKKLLTLINVIKEADSLKELSGVRKIEGYSDYSRIKLGDSDSVLKPVKIKLN